MEDLVRVENLKKYFPIKKGLLGKKISYVKAVDNVSFTIKSGETLGLVGESGCGKTTTGRTVIKLYEPTEGKIYFEDKDITNLTGKEMMPIRRQMQMIFQDPYASLNPRMTVSDIVMESMIVHDMYTEKERRERVKELLDIVGLNSEQANRYPHEFSGGQRQRVGIARALAVEPKFIICDEPISALDVSIQAQIINTLEDLQKKYDLTYLFIAHDLSMVKHISDKIAVMYLGNMVEVAESNELYMHPQHPYTKALLSAIPIPNPDKSKEKKRIMLEGEVPSPIKPPRGCKFHPRCKYKKKICTEEQPILKDLGNNHKIACHLF